MTLRKLYILWLVALAISMGIGTVFFLSTMKITYGNFSGHEDFDGLPYFIASLIVIIFSTGALLASLVSLDKKTPKQVTKPLAKRLLTFYSLFALFCAATFNFAFIYLNPLSLLIFVIIPRLAWNAVSKQSKAKKQVWVLAGLLFAILLLGGLEFLNIILSDPYRK